MTPLGPRAAATLCAVAGVAVSAGLAISLVPELVELGSTAAWFRGRMLAGAALMVLVVLVWSQIRLSSVRAETTHTLAARRVLHDYPFRLSRLLFAGAVATGAVMWITLSGRVAGDALVTGLITYLLLVFPVVGTYLVARRLLRRHVAGPVGAPAVGGDRQSVRLRLAFALQLPVVVCAVGIVLVEQASGSRYEQALEDDYRTRYVYLLERLLRDLDPSTRAHVESEITPPAGVRYTGDEWRAEPADSERALALRLPPLIGLALVLGLAAWFGRWLAGEITRELASLERALAELLSGDLNAAGAARPERPFGLREPADLFDAFARARTGFARQRAAIRDAAQRRRAAEQAKARFLAHLSHELKSPLNSILGFSELMLAGIDGPISERQRQRLTLVWRAGESLLRFILVLLDLARLEVPIEGDQPESRRPTGLEPKAVTGAELAAAMRARLRPDPTGAITLRVDLHAAAADPEVVIDAPHTARAVLALAGTLVDAVEQGVVTIAVSAGDAGALQIEVGVEVTDAEESDRTRLLQRLDAPYDTLPGLSAKRFSAPRATLMLVGWVFEAQGGGVEVVRTRWPRFTLTLPILTPARASSTGDA